MFIEFVGPSGAGKSTIYRELIRVHGRDLVDGKAMVYNTLARRALKNKRPRGYVSALLARGLAKKTGDRRLLKEFGVSDDCAALCEHVFDGFKVHPLHPIVYFERLRRFQSTVAYYSAMQESSDLGVKPVVFDEFFSQRCLAMSIYVDDQQHFIRNFMKRAPRAHLYICVDAPPDLVAQRVRERGRNARELQELEERRSGLHMLKQALDHERANVLELDGTLPLVETTKMIYEALFQLAEQPVQGTDCARV